MGEEWAHLVCLKDTQVKISSEFSIIKKYLSGIGTSYLKSNGVELSVGDDCAIIAAKSKLLISTDTSVAGVHFLKSMQADAIAYRGVATALSDIAAMGGYPIAFNLSLVMPSLNEEWMHKFKKGLQRISKEYKIALVGGDLAKGPLQISVTVLGKPGSNIILRSGARSGDILCISDKLGKAYIGLRAYKADHAISTETTPYLFPKAQILYGQKICMHATSAIDISDGLIQDLSHIIERSGVGCNLDMSEVPIADKNFAKQCLEFGDDYQLLYTVPPSKLSLVKTRLKSIGKKCHTVGVMHGKKLNILNTQYKSFKSWDHFS